eukprot:TRINITY_DN7969_c0_g1_i1.p1 TRINITY_DN7969_c0_g1~~TRINITY_DN7969_c0_g1_i1.p1  ORF type:complete len:150 (+),score=8.59 TRINITY_DN7969_c0_g1_i1:207-656(+)
MRIQLQSTMTQATLLLMLVAAETRCQIQAHDATHAVAGVSAAKDMSLDCATDRAKTYGQEEVCTWGKRCKKCHFPHPEVSSTSIRAQRSTGQEMTQRMNATGLEREQQMQHHVGGWQGGSYHEQEENGFDMNRLPATYETEWASTSIML